ncbi:MAG: hypothetical protein ACE5FK_06300, partial [Candidatus Methylomirabilia bacterium]
HLSQGGSVGGICGGYQMLGQTVSDPYGVESGGAEVGLGLLPVTTVLEPRKTTRRVRARLLPGPWGEGSDEWDAYEIHMGRTQGGEGLVRLFSVRGGEDQPTDETGGLIASNGRAWGTYLHGCLDSPLVRQRLLTWLRAQSVPPAPASSLDYRDLREAAYDDLARALRDSLNLPAIRALIRL